MPALISPPSLPLPDVTVRRAVADDLPVLERLWLLFRHDLSRFNGDLPNADGTYRSERLELAMTDPGWAAFIGYRQDSPLGFAFVRSLDRQPFVLNSFFVVAAARGTGLSGSLVHHVLTAFPGSWEVAFQDSNTVAGHFWRKVAAAHDSRWAEEHRRVPGRPHLQPDSWITFEVRPD